MSEFQAIWDTGAQASVITQAVVDACGLKPTGMTRVQGVHGISVVETYVIMLRLSNGVGFRDVAVSKGELGAGPQVLLGMDVITKGDFAITNKGGSTVFSFRTPSEADVDYVAEHNAINAERAKKAKPPLTKNQRRNERKKFRK
jgi:hypothetical protein